MSDTDEMIPPAAATASQLYHSRGTMPSVRFLWGVATLSLASRSSTEVTVLAMPSGRRILVSTNSAQGIPLTAATTSPAAMNIRFE